MSQPACLTAREVAKRLAWGVAIVASEAASVRLYGWAMTAMALGIAVVAGTVTGVTWGLIEAIRERGGNA